MKKVIKNIILHFTSYAKLKFDASDFVNLRINGIKKTKFLNSIINEMQEELCTTSVMFTLKKECNKEINIEHDGMGTIKSNPFDYIDNGGQIRTIELVYEDNTNEYIKIALFDDSLEPENNFHCESKLLVNGDLYVSLDESVNKDLSNFSCK